MNKFRLPNIKIEARATVIPPGDPRHRGNPDHPEHARWLAEVAEQRRRKDEIAASKAQKAKE